MQNLADLNLEKAECHKQEDLEMIHKAVEKKVGFHQLNSTITALLRQWLVRTARQAVQKQQRGARQSGWWKRQSGIERNTDLAILLNQIARFIKGQGKYDEAEPLAREAVGIYRKVHGDEHPLLATGLNTLAGLLESQGKYDEAEPLYRESLAIDKKIYGDDHPEVATDLNNLAGLLKAQGKTNEARKMGQEALRIARKVLGNDHPDTQDYQEWWGQ